LALVVVGVLLQSDEVVDTVGVMGVVLSKLVEIVAQNYSVLVGIMGV
jgi:hypothetical protein